MFAALNAFQVGGAIPTYISDVFSTTLYTGSGASQTITNGIDLSNKGGLVWTKLRSGSLGTASHALTDTARGVNNYLSSNNTNAATTSWTDTLTSFNSNGYTLGADALTGLFNYSSTNNYASWTFRKQPKFFDVVTYTGNGASGRAIPHSLASVPGCMIVKRTNTTGDWAVYQRATSATPWHDVGFLNSTSAWYIGFGQGDPFWAGIAPTSTNFYVDTTLNNSGDTYVAYLFAHNAGGFGASGNDNVITCGSFTTDSSSIATVNLGYQPQWILVKNTQTSGNHWFMWDIARGCTADGTSGDYYLIPDLVDAESGGGDYGGPTSTGFVIRNLQSSNDFIYIAIRASS